MHLLPGRAGKLESAVATLILFVLIATAVGVYIVGRDVNITRFGVVSGQTQQVQPEQSSPKKANESDKLFAGLTTDDFPAAGAAETYNADNLYEKIDGKAPLYIDTGFVAMTSQRFANSKNPDLGLEVYLYDMGNSRNAFSVYSRQKRADGVDLKDLAAPSFGYRAGNAICISRGKYYLEMIGFAESDELIGVMKGIAQKMTAKLPSDEKDKITELSYFPQEGIVAGTWKLQINNAFGFDGLTDTYSAQYKTGDKSVAIFFSRRGSADEAKTLAKSYNDFLTTNGAKNVSTDSETLKTAGASVMDFFGSTEIVFPAGRFIGGVHEADDKQAAQKAAEILFDRLNKVSGETGD